MPRILELDWDAVLGREVRIYRNLNNQRISVQTKREGRWLVAGHVTDCVLAEVRLCVKESGRQRVIREQTKNVHAYASGTLIAQFNEAIATPIDLAYNPYVNPTFVERFSQRSISECQYLTVRDNRVLVSRDALTQHDPIVTPSLINRIDRLFVRSLQWQGVAA